MMIRAIVNYFSFVVAGALLLIAALIIHFWPASWWMEVRSVRVDDSRVGEQVVMAVDRTVHRDFQADWLVTIRQWQGGGWVPFCHAAGPGSYHVDSKFPDPLTLKWWTHPNCHPLPVGKYVMRTSWKVLGDGVLPDKIVPSISNIFEIKP